MDDAPIYTARDFIKYLKSKEKKFNKNYEIMEMVFNLQIEYQFLSAAQSEWQPKPQHLWIYSLSFDDKTYDRLLPYLFLTVICMQGKSSGDYYYMYNRHILRFQCLTFKFT